MDVKLLFIGVSIIFVLTLVGIVSVQVLGPENDVEEAVEEVIQAMTGHEIDLSPNEDW